MAVRNIYRCALYLLYDSWLPLGFLSVLLLVQVLYNLCFLAIEFIKPLVIHGFVILLRLVVFGLLSLHVFSIEDWKIAAKFQNYLFSKDRLIFV